ncbi:MAG: hypothetical protein OXC37_06340 [Bdellovibrionaceae bacterium]|nr:hypothetical protein [Pseudobdellovibrionaceae bacterium]
MIFSIRNFLICLFFLSACFSDKTFFHFFKKESCEKKIKNFYKASREIFLDKAKTCLKENKPKQAVIILEHLLQRDKIQEVNFEQQKELTKELANKSFYYLKNYRKALKYYTALLKMPLKPREKISIQHYKAKSFYYLKKHSQALKEIEKNLTKELSIEERKKALLLKAEIFIAQNQFDKAGHLFQNQIESFPDQEDFFRENLAVIYESQKKFSMAIEELEKIEKPSSFVLKKIKRLKARKNNQPRF